MHYSLLFLFKFIFLFTPAKTDAVPKSIYDFKVAALDGSTIDFSKYKGKKIMIVNTASQCGNTPQYAELEAMSKKYKDKLVFSFSICLNNGGGAVYFDREVWLGRIDENGVLSVEENTATVEKIVTDYGFDQRVDFETEKAAILNYQTKQKEMEAAKSRVKLKDFINHVF